MDFRQGDVTGLRSLARVVRLRRAGGSEPLAPRVHSALVLLARRFPRLLLRSPRGHSDKLLPRGTRFKLLFYYCYYARRNLRNGTRVSVELIFK